MRIVILGANGQVGRVVFAQCCHHFPQAEVIGCVRQFHLHFEGCTGSKLQHSIVFDPFKDDWSKLGKTDVLINCVGIIRETKDITFEKAHIGLPRLILQHRAAAGNPRVIQVSVLGAARQSSSRFMSTKAIADEALLEESNTFVVRPSIVCTHNTMMVQKMKLVGRMARWSFGRLLFPGHFLSTKIQPVLGDDVGDVIAAIAGKGAGERIVNITGPGEIMLEQLLRILNKGKIKIVPISKGLFNLVLPVARLLAPAMADREQLALLSDNNTADNTACAALLGRPMRSTWDFWKRELQ